MEGNRKEGEIRADSLDTAIQKLSANGQLVISMKEVDDTFDFLGPFLDEIQLSIEKAKNRIPLSNIVFFTRQLATMFSAGLTLERAIQSLGAEEKHKKFRKILNSVSDNIRKGLNMSESLSRHPGVFNTLFVAMVKAGEISHIIEKTMNTTKDKNPILLPNQLLKSIICLVAAGNPAPSCAYTSENFGIITNNITINIQIRKTIIKIG